jgi:hypothetical protein
LRRTFAPGQLVRLPGETRLAVIDSAAETSDVEQLYLGDGSGGGGLVTATSMLCAGRSVTEESAHE